MVFPERRRRVELILTSRQQDEISETAQPTDPVPGDDTEDGTETQVGGYVDSDNEEGMEEIQPVRPQQVRRPPDRYGTYVEHRNLARMQDTRRGVM